MSGYKESLIAAKQRLAEKRKAAGARRLDRPGPDRLPPGQKLVTNFPVLDLGVQPDVPVAAWKLEVGGLVERPVVFDWESLHALPRTEDVSDFHCVTTWSKYDCRWAGVAMVDLLEHVGPRPEATHVFFTAYDGYTTNVPLAALLDDDVVLATSFEGAPIPREHGGPARVIIPKLYAWKGAKWVNRIEFLPEDRLGFWELRGYSNTADPFTDDRFA